MKALDINFFEIHEKDLQMIRLAYETAALKGIAVEDALECGIWIYFRLYKDSGEQQYLYTALLHMRVYLELGFSYDKKKQLFDSVLESGRLDRQQLFPRSSFNKQTAKANRSQLAVMIGKWMPSKENPMTKKQLIDEIIEKVAKHIEGEYCYIYRRKEQVYIYRLAVTDTESSFYDAARDRFYIFDT